MPARTYKLMMHAFLYIAQFPNMLTNSR